MRKGGATGVANRIALDWGNGFHGKPAPMGLDHYRRDRIAIAMLNRAQLKRLLVEAINRLDGLERGRVLPHA